MNTVTTQFRSSVFRVRPKPGSRIIKPKPVNKKLLAARKPYRPAPVKSVFKKTKRLPTLLAEATAGKLPFEQRPLRHRLYLRRSERGLTRREFARLFNLTHHAIGGWEVGPDRELSRGRLGWEIPPQWTPMVEEWIATGNAPSAEAIAAAKKFQPFKKRKKYILDKLKATASGRLPSNPKVSQIVGLYLGHISDRISAQNLYRKKNVLERFVEHMGHIKASTLKPIHLETYLQETCKGQSPWTSFSVATHIRACFNWAVDMELIVKTPFRKMKMRPGAPREPITPDEFQTLLRFSSTCMPEGWKRPRWMQRPTHFARLRQMLIFLYRTGARPSEARELKWEHIDFEQGIIRQLEHKTAKTTRVFKPRIIYLDAVAVKLLRWIQTRDPSPDYVFRSSRGKPWVKDGLCMKLRRVRAKAGLPDHATAYSVRHGFATRAIKQKLDIKTLSELLGHSTTRMSEHYVHLSGQHGYLSDAVRQVNSTPARKAVQA